MVGAGSRAQHRLYSWMTKLFLVFHFINTVTFVAPNLACGKARGERKPRSGSVTDEQRSHRPNSAQPSGRQFYRLRCSLLTDPLPDMLVALLPRLAEKSL